MIRRGKKTFEKPHTKEIRVKLRSITIPTSPINKKLPSPIDYPRSNVEFEAPTSEQQNQILEQCYKDYWSL